MQQRNAANPARPRDDVCGRREAEKLEADEETMKEKDVFGAALPADTLGFNRMNDAVGVRPARCCCRRIRGGGGGGTLTVAASFWRSPLLLITLAKTAVVAAIATACSEWLPLAVVFHCLRAHEKAFNGQA